MREFLQGQATLEIAIAIALAIVLVVGTISTWTYFNKTMAERLDNYKATRHIALVGKLGTPTYYNPDDFDIFSMSPGLNDTPGYEAPNLTEGGLNESDIQACYDAYTVAFEQVPLIFQQATILMQESSNYTSQSTELRAELGPAKVFGWENYPVPHWEVLGFNIDFLLYYNIKAFYEKSWKSIKDQFEFITTGGIFAFLLKGKLLSESDIKHDYINDGVGLEILAEQKMQEAILKQGEAYATMADAYVDLISCLYTNMPQGNECIDDCYDTYGKAAEEKGKQASVTCAEGSLDFCQIQLNETQVLAEQYSDCVYDCFNSTK